MLVTQLLINLGIYGGIPLLLLISAYFYGNKIASGQAELDQLKSEMELNKSIHKAEKENQETEKQKDEQIKKVMDSTSADELISLFKSLFK